jgi:hypothetical protein
MEGDSREAVHLIGYKNDYEEWRVSEDGKDVDS